jgi:hypothetical protein
MDIQKIVTAPAEHTREMHGLEPEVLALHEQIRVQKSISDAHYENYCEMLKRVDAVARERDKASEEVKRLTSALCNSNAQQLDQALHERDEARAEVEKRKEALIDASRLIDELKEQRNHWHDKAIQENEKLLNANTELGCLKTELAQAISGRTPHDCGLLKFEIECLKQSLHDARLENSGQAAEIERINVVEIVAECEQLRSDLDKIKHQYAVNLKDFELLCAKSAILTGQRNRAITAAQWLRSCRPSEKKFKVAEAELEALEKEVQG